MCVCVCVCVYIFIYINKCRNSKSLKRNMALEKMCAYTRWKEVNEKRIKRKRNKLKELKEQK